MLVACLWVCFSTLRLCGFAREICERNTCEWFVLILTLRYAESRIYPNIGAQAQMPVDKELLKYCANFARVTPRVTPLPKGCMCPPVLRSFLACTGLPMRVPLWGTDLLTAEEYPPHRVSGCFPCAIYSPNGAEAWVSPVKRRQERRPGVRFGLYLLLR